jgi:UDP-N-acetylmuramate--alanine ligase
MEHYKNFDNLKKAFLKFIDNIPFYGLVVLCIDHPIVLEISKNIQNKRFITYGFSENAEIRGHNLRTTVNGTYFDVDISLKKEVIPVKSNQSVVYLPKRYKDLFLPMVGSHNVLNFLSCIAVSVDLNIEEDIIRKTLETFKGVKRRFTKIATVKGITIIDDYAHHPVEIETVIKAAKQCEPKKIIAVIQPHRYTRLQDLMEDFVTCTKQADIVVVAPVYAANEEPIKNVSSTVLAQKMRDCGQTVYEINDSKELCPLLTRIAQKDDMILCMGAGSITNWAAQLPLELEQTEFESATYPMQTMFI